MNRMRSTRLRFALFNLCRMSRMSMASDTIVPVIKGVLVRFGMFNGQSDLLTQVWRGVLSSSSLACKPCLSVSCPHHFLLG